MSSREPKLVPTNLPATELIMDERGKKDSRYYCLPPFRGDRTRSASERRGGGYPFHLVAQGHVVGTYNNWLHAKASLVGYPDASNQGFNSEEECIEAWQELCPLGIHPHPVDPEYLAIPSASAAGFVNMSPRKSSAKPRSGGRGTKHEGSPVKREGTPAAPNEDRKQVLADLKRYCSPVVSPAPSPKKGPSSPAVEESSYVNFAIRGGGIISSSLLRSEERYREMQRRGEQPDMLVTRSFEQASLFALEDADEEAD
ncbi:hypothetical protein B0H11DRAFT_1944507 [Mycena galericulata]|nr:hypothetical protein B0H11DRAFT_1944507 [Mycena galericulata]